MTGLRDKSGSAFRTPQRSAPPRRLGLAFFLGGELLRCRTLAEKRAWSPGFAGATGLETCAAGEGTGMGGGATWAAAGRPSTSGTGREIISSKSTSARKLKSPNSSDIGCWTVETAGKSPNKAAISPSRSSLFAVPKKTVLACLGDLQVFHCELTSAGWSQCGTSFSQFSFAVPAAVLRFHRN